VKIGEMECGRVVGLVKVVSAQGYGVERRNTGAKR